MPKKRYLYFLSFIQLSPLFVWDTFLPIMPSMAKKYEIDSTLMSYGITIFAFSYILSSQISAYLSDKYTPKYILPIGLIVGGSINFLIPFVNNFYIFLLLRAITGVFLSVTISINSIVNDIYNDQERIKVFSIMTSLAGIGLAIAPVIGVQLSKFFGDSSIFIFLSIYCIISASFSRIILKNIVYKEKHNGGFTIKNVLSLLRNKEMLYLSHIRLFSYLPHFIFVTFSSIVLIEHFRMEKGTYSLIMFLLGVSSILGGYISHFLFAKIGLHKTTLLGCFMLFLGSIVSLFLIFNPELNIKFISLIIITFCILISIGRTLLSPFISVKITEKFSNCISSASSLSMIYMYLISIALATYYSGVQINIVNLIFATSLPICIVLSLIVISYHKSQKKFRVHS